MSFAERPLLQKLWCLPNCCLSVCYVFGGCTQFYNACVSAYTETNFAKYVLPKLSLLSQVKLKRCFCTQFLSAVRSIRFVSSAVGSNKFSEVNTMRNSFVMCLSPRTVIYNCQKLKNDVEVKFLGSRQPVTANVLRAGLVAVWNTNVSACIM